MGEIGIIAAVTTDIGSVEILIIGQRLPITIFSPLLLMILAKQTFFCTNVKNLAFFKWKSCFMQFNANHWFYPPIYAKWLALCSNHNFLSISTSEEGFS